jgi:hypothetical protein
MDGMGQLPPSSPAPHERATPQATRIHRERTGSNASSTGGRIRTSSRETAEPLAHALDATLSHLMDEKISNFGKAFKNMETRLNRQQTLLNDLEKKIDEEDQVARAENEEIAVKVAAIHKLIDENVSEAELDTLKQRIGVMEHYVREEIEGKLEQIDSMHDALTAFSSLGENVKSTQEEAQEKTKKAHEETRAHLEQLKAKKTEEMIVRRPSPRPLPVRPVLPAAPAFPSPARRPELATCAQEAAGGTDFKKRSDTVPAGGTGYGGGACRTHRRHARFLTDLSDDAPLLRFRRLLASVLCCALLPLHSIDRATG